MVGAVGDFTLQSMARTNHKFPGYGGPGVPSEVKSTVAGAHHYFHNVSWPGRATRVLL